MKHIIKPSGSTRLAALLAGAALFGLMSQNALAAGTAAGTPISNSATLDYSVGGFSQTAITSAAASFVVDEKINLTVLGGVTTTVLPNSTGQATAFSVTNNANSALDFSLAATMAIAGDNFDPSACSVFVESGATPSYQPLEDIGTFIDELPVDTSKTVYAVCTIPLVANGQTGLVGLTATARGDFTTPVTGAYAATATALGAVITETAAADTAGTVDIVFADVAGTDDSVGARDAQHSDRNTYSVSITVPTVVKSSTVLCDPFNGITNPKRIPGAIVQYSVVVNNPSAVSVTLTSIADTLDIASGNVAFDPGLRAPVDAATCIAGVSTSGMQIVSSVGGRALGGAAGVMTNAADADGGTFASPTVTIDYTTALPAGGAYAAGELKAGESATVTFNVIVTP